MKIPLSPLLGGVSEGGGDRENRRRLKLEGLHVVLHVRGR